MRRITWTTTVTAENQFIAIIKGRDAKICDLVEIFGTFSNKRLDCADLSAEGGLLTAIGNDYGFDYVFSRQIEGLGQSGDVLFAITTSGNSSNVLEAVKAAKKKGVISVAVTGRNGGEIVGLADHSVIVRNNATSHIQENHIFFFHLLGFLVEQKLGLCRVEV